MRDVRVIINTCCGKTSTPSCNGCLIGAAFTNADGYYEIMRRASRNNRYFFTFDSGEFSTITADPRGGQFDVMFAGSEKAFRNDFHIGQVSYWHKVHVKNVNPVGANDRLLLIKPFSAQLVSQDSIVFRGPLVDTSIVMRMKFLNCCTDNAIGESAGYDCIVNKNNNWQFIRINQPIKPRDTTFYDILY